MRPTDTTEHWSIEVSYDGHGPGARYHHASGLSNTLLRVVVPPGPSNEEVSETLFEEAPHRNSMPVLSDVCGQHTYSKLTGYSHLNPRHIVRW